MKKLLAYLLALTLVCAAPVAESASKRHGKSGHKAHATKVVQKAKDKKKARIGAKARKNLAAKQHKRYTAKFQAQRLQREQETWLGMSPRLAGQDAANALPGDPATNGELELRSAAVLVVDQKTGESLYAKNADVATPIASITKLMTSMVVLDAGLGMTEPISISAEDVDHLKYTGSRVAVGTTLTREELMHLALIASENRAAAALSRAYPGGREAFVKAMNRKAAVLGMTNTWFVDGTGLSSANRSTAADLVRLVDAACDYPLIRLITSTGQYGISVPGRRMVKVRENGRTRRVALEVERRIAFYNTNALTRSKEWEIGVSKTGFINEAGHCLVMQASIGERKVIMVLLDSWGKLSRIGDASRIRKWLENGAAARLASQPLNNPA